MALQLFVDGSCDPNSKIGYGAMLGIERTDARSVEALAAAVVAQRFQPCASSSLELMTVLWAFGEFGEAARGATVFTDSQTIVGLPLRREALCASGFCSRSGRELSQASLYRDFYDAIDGFSPQFVKVKGHRPGSEKSREERLFTLVDRASRAALRAEVARRP